jgi:hypothetical protein
MTMTMHKAASLLEKLKSSEVRRLKSFPIIKSGILVSTAAPRALLFTRAQVLIERRLRWVKRQLQDGEDEGLQVATRPQLRPATCFLRHYFTRPQSNMAHLIGTQTKLKEMQITILKLALMAQKKHEMEVRSGAAWSRVALLQRRAQQQRLCCPGHAGRCVGVRSCR